MIEDGSVGGAVRGLQILRFPVQGWLEFRTTIHIFLSVDFNTSGSPVYSLDAKNKTKKNYLLLREIGIYLF